MVRKHVAARGILALCLVLCLTMLSCTKLDQPKGPLTYETIKFNNAIPQEYGPLIGVVQAPQTPGEVGLWFQKSDGSITAVFVNIQTGKIHDKTLTIPRK